MKNPKGYCDNKKNEINFLKKNLPTSGVGPPTFRLQGERNNHYATQAYVHVNIFRLINKINSLNRDGQEKLFICKTP